MKYHFKHIGDNIARIRKELGISRAKLSEKSGVAIKSIDVIEWHGNDCHVSTLFRIAEALNISIHELFKT